MIISIVGIIIGLMILGAGLYYLKKEKNDKESRKIYGITSGAGCIIVLVAAIYLITVIR